MILKTMECPQYGLLWRKPRGEGDVRETRLTHANQEVSELCQIRATLKEFVVPIWAILARAQT